MYTRHDEVPVLSEWPATVDAGHYHIVYRALKRTPPSIRLVLPGLKTLDLILQADAWVIVDRAFNDVPVAAWVGFKADQREGLHEPVGCDLRYYHGHAGMIIKQVLDLMDALLQEQLDDGEDTHDVIAFPTQNQDEDG